MMESAEVDGRVSGPAAASYRSWFKRRARLEAENLGTVARGVFTPVIKNEIFVHGRAALSTPQGQLAAGLAEILLRGFSQTRLIRLIALLRSQSLSCRESSENRVGRPDVLAAGSRRAVAIMWSGSIGSSVARRGHDREVRPTSQVSGRGTAATAGAGAQSMAVSGSTPSSTRRPVSVTSSAAGGPSVSALRQTVSSFAARSSWPISAASLSPS